MLRRRRGGAGGPKFALRSRPPGHYRSAAHPGSAANPPDTSYPDQPGPGNCPPKFAAQFKGKTVRDPFVVGRDVDAVSRASISIGSATRAIRDSSRMMAKQLLPDAVK